MRFDSIESLKVEGSESFRRVGELMRSCDGVPAERGVYLVLYLNSDNPKFLERGRAGCFKGKDPNERIYKLYDKWVQGTIVINIGKTNRTLCERISEYMEFGKGEGKGHHGGRYIWQTQNCGDLILCWKRCANCSRSSEEIECDMILEFKRVYGKLPFANLKGCRPRGSISYDR